MAILLYAYFTKDIYQKASGQQIQLCTALSNSLDNEEKQMDTISMNITYSNLIKYHFQKFLVLSSDNTNSNLEISSERYANINTLMDVVMAIIGPQMPVTQANIYDMNGKMVGAGRFSGEAEVDLKQMPWYKKTMGLDGNRYLGVPMPQERLNDLNTFYKDNQYISLTRVYKNSNYENQGIIEVLQNCDTMFRFVNEVRAKDNSIEIYIINPDGQSVYPYRSTSGSDGKYYYRLIKEDGLSMLVTHSINNSERIEKEAMTYTISKLTGWTIIVVQSQSVILKSVNRFARYFALLSLLVIMITLVVSYMVSKNVTTPLKNLRNSIKSMELTDLSANSQIFKPNERQYVDEIEKLHYAFTEMNRKLGISLNEILTSKNEELNAKMLALQSQMNPHFLHNNLTTISVMAEEEMNKQIVSLCSDISFMLRYIATEDRSGVRLHAELEYTKKYLNSMKIRYESDLNYEFEIKGSMLDIIVPKLIVQPLVENSIKFSLKNSPPWHIFITGKTTDDKWMINVSDKGPGFGQMELQKIKQFIEEYKELTSIPDLKIGGMGLLNVYLRLRFLYKDSIIFEVANLPEGGASVTIGGNINVPGEEDKHNV